MGSPKKRITSSHFFVAPPPPNTCNQVVGIWVMLKLNSKIIVFVTAPHSFKNNVHLVVLVRSHDTTVYWRRKHEKILFSVFQKAKLARLYNKETYWVNTVTVAPLLAMMCGRVDYNLALSYCGSCTDIMAYVYCIYTISRMTISLGRLYLVKAASSNVLPQAWIAHLHTQCKISAFATKNRLSHKS